MITITAPRIKYVLTPLGGIVVCSGLSRVVSSGVVASGVLVGEGVQYTVV